MVRGRGKDLSFLISSKRRISAGCLIKGKGGAQKWWRGEKEKRKRER